MMREIHSSVDRRAVSEVIGSILVFGLVVLLLTIVQTQAVPSANQDVEIEHSQAVQEDVARLSSAVSQAAIGQESSVTVATGTSYPNRLVLFNPPAPAGSLRSTDGGTVELSNVRGFSPQSNDYIDGSLAYETAGLEYSVSYNRYHEAPTTGFEYGVVYDRYDDGTVTVENGGSLVRGRTISLTLLEGDLQRAGQRTTTVDLYTVSGPARTVQVTNTSGSDLTLTVPTTLSEEVWVTELLAGQLDDSGDGGPGLEGDETACSDLTGSTSDGDGRYVVSCSYDGAAGEMTLTFQRTENGDPVRYDLRTSKVGFDDRSPSLDQYVVNVDSLDQSVQAGEEVELRVEVRDEYNNPVSGVQVAAVVNESDFSSTDAEEVTSPATTNEEGVATVTYQAPSSGSQYVGEDRTVTVTTDTDVSEPSDLDTVPDRHKVSFEVTVNGDAGNILTGPPQIQFVAGSGQVNGPSMAEDNGIQFAVENDGSVTSGADLTGVKVSVGDAATRLREGSSGDDTWTREVFVQKQTLATLDGASASAEAGGEGPGETLGYYDVSDSSAEKIEFEGGETVLLEGGDQATYYIYAFADESGSTVDMHGKTVTITVYYEYDGNEYTLTRTVTFPSG